MPQLGSSEYCISLLELAAGRRFLERAINLHSLPEKITIDKSDANMAVIENVKTDASVENLMRQNKYLNNIVEQDHRAVKKNHPSDARIQVVVECSNPHRWYRDNAHDPQGADELPRRINHVSSTAVLKPRRLITGLAMQLLAARLH